MAEARQAGDAELEIGLLGPLEVRARGETIRIGGPKPRALLAVLALEVGRAVTVDRLVEALWPSDPPETAGHAVQVYVSQLRKALGASTIGRGPAGYELALEPERVDVHRFARLAAQGRASRDEGDMAAAATTLREALGLWRGSALAEFTYEPFAQTEITQLEELRLVALEERIDADLALARHADVVPELEALVDTQPLRERPRAQLMLALYRCGRQADALAAYRAARETLVDELGIEPGTDLKELEAAILRQDPALVLDGGASAPAVMQFRRLVTILFVDVVGSLSLAAALDAEALGQVLERYFETVSAALLRHGATVERYAGDAVMAAFGIPVSHEDDALRAARAALEVRASVAELKEHLEREHGRGVDVRIGFETGEVVASPTPSRRRPLAGEAVAIAAALEQAAGPGDVLVGEVAARLIDHAAALEPLGDLEVEGRSESVRRFRLVDLVPASPAFERRLDAPLVGRGKALAALRKELRAAADSGLPRAAVVVGPAGVGKSRLVAELAGRATGATTLWGRCLSYGDGITYWPVRDAVAQAPESVERTLVLDALESDVALPASEIAVLVRRFCEAVARAGPLILVFDDVHWAEPTFLDLVEHVVERGGAPFLVVCAAREELDETRPGFLAEQENGSRIDLDVLSPEETEALVDGLGGGVLESDQRARIVEAAEGNPFFVEQLLALAYDGGLAALGLPETVRAVLAARLDGLGPGERAVLERAAVIGKRFRLDDVAALLDPEAVATLDSHISALVAGGFLRPDDGGEHRFRHVLIQEAVYRAAPKRLRAELHERFVGRFEGRAWALGDVDEFTGYHLERAFRLRAELGESEGRSAQLADDAGRRLGAAGLRALKRGDMPATRSLLERAVSLLPGEDETRLELLCELGIAQAAMGDDEAASASLSEAIAGAERAGLGRIELRARIEATYRRLLAEPEGAADELLSLAESAMPTFEALDDDRSLARAWLLTGYVRGGIRGNHAAWEEAEERALVHYRRIAFPPATPLGQVAAAIYWGPTPVPRGIERCEELLSDRTIGHFGRAAVLPYLGGLHAQAGRFDHARELVVEAEQICEELGAAATAMVTCGTVRADIELLAVDFLAAEQALRHQCEYLARVHDRSHLAIRAAKLAEAIFRQGRPDDAAHWAGVSRANAASDDWSVQVVVGPVEAKLLAARGALTEARHLAEDVVRVADRTDGLNQIATARLALAGVLRSTGRHGDAQRVVDAAIELFQRKGNLVGVAQARDALGFEVPA